MSINPIGDRRRNGFINILFNASETLEPRPKARDDYQFSKFVEEHVFIPRNKVKNIRILKINDTIYNFNSLKSNHIKRMFIDGSHVRELTPNREILTQDQARKTSGRGFSPDLVSKRESGTKRNLSCYEEKGEGS